MSSWMTCFTFAGVHLGNDSAVHFYRCVFIQCLLNVNPTPILGVFVVVATPARIAQFMYDQARQLASMPFGWLIIWSLMSASLRFGAGDAKPCQSWSAFHRVSDIQHWFRFPASHMA